LLAWAGHFMPPRLTVLTHGEPNASQTLAKLLEDKLHFTVMVPKKGETIQLEAR
jgi:metallo-beta-lactamase family protein